MYIGIPITDEIFIAIGFDARIRGGRGLQETIHLESGLIEIGLDIREGIRIIEDITDLE